MILSITIMLNIVLSVKSMLESETKDIKKVGTRKKKKGIQGKLRFTRLAIHFFQIPRDCEYTCI